jgi:glycosyltransferase involved in cell wall biosynthesis
LTDKNPVISVVMSVYNGEEYLEDSIESILNQTYKNFEFIIINDGSTDKTLNIIKKYKTTDNRIFLIDRENKGLVFSLNEGITAARGKYIARMDADDISLPTRFEEQVLFMDKNTQIGVCGTWVRLFGNVIRDNIWKIPVNNKELHSRILFSVPVAHPSVIIRKSVLDKYSIKYNEKYKHAEDYKFWLDLYKYTEFSNIPKVLLNYRYLETSVSRIADNSNSNTRFTIISSIFNEILIILKITNTKEENKLHFILGLNKRIDKEIKYINIYSLFIYLQKIIKANSKVGYFDKKYLRKFLIKKFMIVIYFKLKNLFF